ncbi:MAG TPA: sigma-70 family RNA polymerase sigma factor [Actinomycetota bacterium]|nr:sigma-70 family RNA polymerase sigma factor [Actinomycetota bacterium]
MSRHHLEEQTDETLIAAFVKTGDQAPLEVLLARHEPRVFGLAYRILGNRADAFDATQDVFLTVFRRASSFRHQAAFATWLYRLTTNACHDIGRRKARTPVPVEDMPARVSSTGSEERSDARLAVEQALRGLSEEQRVPVVMRDLYAMTYEEISSALRIPPGTVRSRIARGRIRLAELLGAGEQGEPGTGPRRLTET